MEMNITSTLTWLSASLLLTLCLACEEFQPPGSTQNDSEMVLPNGDEVSENANVTGHCKSGDCENGTGVMEYKNATYQGEFRNGKLHGKGLLRFNDGDSYEGEFANNLKEGRGHFISVVDGWEYKGELLNDWFDGTGVFTNQHGDRYEGQFSKGFYSGYGTIEYELGEEAEEDEYHSYYGEWEEDEHVGYGIVRYVNGTYAAGRWSGNTILDSAINIDDVKEYLNATYGPEWQVPEDLKN